MDPAREKRLSLFILLVVTLLTAVMLRPELTVTRVDLNDNVSHFTLIQGMVQAIERGENPLDFWSPEAALGYPEVRTYQLLAHALVVLLYFLLGKTVSLMTVFIWVRCLSLVCLPLSLYAAAMLLELSPLTGAAAALLIPLLATDNLYGLELRSFLWRGFGLFPQAVAVNFVLLAIGYSFRAIRRGTSLVTAGILLGLTALSHLIYGYIGALTACLLALLPDREVSRAPRVLRTVAIGAVAAVVSLFQLLPLVLDRAIINHSVNEPAWKWDSFGAGKVLGMLFGGDILDAGRLPVLSLLAAAGAAMILWRYRQARRLRPVDSFVLSAAVLWVLIFFGRNLWGPLLLLIGVSPDMHLHRVVGAVQIFLVLLAAMALAAGWRAVARRTSALIAAIGTGILLWPAIYQTVQYVAEDGSLGSQTLASYDAEKTDIEDLMRLLKERGGRVYAGLASGWGAQFNVGIVPIYGILSVNQVPAVSNLYHTMALPGDIMARFNELKPPQFRLFDIRSVLVPAAARQYVPPFLTANRQIGRFLVLDPPPSGYFDLVDAPAAVSVDKATFYQVNDRWFQSPWVDNRTHLWLDFFGDVPAGVTRVAPDAPLPTITFPSSPPGEVHNEQEKGGVYQAQLDATRAGFALFKMTWHPNWHVLLDGQAVKTVMLSPGFLAVPVTAGRHQIVCRYEPGNWKLWLALVCILIPLSLLAAERFGYLPRIGPALEVKPEAEPAVVPVVAKRAERNQSKKARKGR